MCVCNFIYHLTIITFAHTFILSLSLLPSISHFLSFSLSLPPPPSFSLSLSLSVSLSPPCSVEYTRVSLHPVEGLEGSDYINANYITVSVITHHS